MKANSGDRIRRRRRNRFGRGNITMLATFRRFYRFTFTLSPASHAKFGEGLLFGRIGNRYNGSASGWLALTNFIVVR